MVFTFIFLINPFQISIFLQLSCKNSLGTLSGLAFKLQGYFPMFFIKTFSAITVTEWLSTLKKTLLLFSCLFHYIFSLPFTLIEKKCTSCCKRKDNSLFWPKCEGPCSRNTISGYRNERLYYENIYRLFIVPEQNKGICQGICQIYWFGYKVIGLKQQRKISAMHFRCYLMTFLAFGLEETSGLLNL